MVKFDLTIIQLFIMINFFQKSKVHIGITNFLATLTILLAIAGVIYAVCIYVSNLHFSKPPKFESGFSDFFSGLIGTVFSILSSLLLIYTLYKQNIEKKKDEITNHFFKMIDYHNENVSQLKLPNLKNVTTDNESEGRKAFVEFKLQIHHLLKIVETVNQENNYNLSKENVIDIAYILFYYGIDEKWIYFTREKLKKYDVTFNNIVDQIHNRIKSNVELDLARTNQTYLSVYFRNMYNAIKLVDEALVLTPEEKQNLVRIYRAQLSNPELYVLFFNLNSRFGKNWKSKEYITKYKFIKNIPPGYCDGYTPNDYFERKYEDEEYD